MHEEMSDGEITLRLVKEIDADPCKDWVAARDYSIIVGASSVIAGGINIRLGYTLSLARYGGNIGYGVRPEFRGHHYAGKACKLIREVAVAQGMDVLWITCNPENLASRKTCEWIGATLVETVDLPPDNDQYADGDRRKCRYRWIIY